MRIFRSRLLTYLKNYEVKNIFLRFPVIFLTVIAMEVLSMMKSREALPILKEVFEFLKAIKPTLKERKRVQRLRKVSDKQISENTRTPEHLSILKAITLL